VLNCIWRRQLQFGYKFGQFWCAFFPAYSSVRIHLFQCEDLVRPKYKTIRYLQKDAYLKYIKIRLLSHQIWDRVPNSMTSDEEVMSYPAWTLLPNLNSMKIRLKTM
jgi:hypothetical protein